MKIYLVGGAIRDELLGIKSLEKDVSKLLINNGYIPVASAVITYFFVKKDLPTYHCN